jgi:formylglycine-generating enzyme required for sulfatase activity
VHRSAAASTLLLLLSACAAGGGAGSATTGFTNTLGMHLLRIPAGEFVMGSEEPIASLHKAYPQTENYRLENLSDEAPAHKVRITKPFYMGATEVTVGQFRQFVARSGYVPESIADGTGGYGYNAHYDASKSQRGDAFEGRDVRYSWQDPGFAQTDAHPVVNVTWNDAQALAAWLSQQEGRSYHIPTEAQWEYAARAGTTTRYHCGDDPNCLLQVANTFDEAAQPFWPQFATNALPGNDGYAFTAPVASFAPNAFGLYDMHGNAWEWTQDLYGEDYYAKSPVDDPKGPDDGQVYVRRGGSWHTWSLYARSSYRNWNSPQTRYTLVGIRLIADVSPAKL